MPNNIYITIIDNKTQLTRERLEIYVTLEWIHNYVVCWEGRVCII